MDEVEYRDRGERIKNDDVFFSSLLKCYRTGLHSDVAIKCGEREFRAHKLILSVASPVFQAALSSPMIEATSNIVAIHDFSVEAVENFLEFVYGADLVVSRLERSLVHELIKMANKYQHPELQYLCSSSLSGSITIDSCFSDLYLSHQYDFTTLKGHAVSFIQENARELMYLRGAQVADALTSKILPEINMGRFTVEELDSDSSTCEWIDEFNFSIVNPYVLHVIESPVVRKWRDVYWNLMLIINPNRKSVDYRIGFYSYGENPKGLSGNKRFKCYCSFIDDRGEAYAKFPEELFTFKEAESRGKRVECSTVDASGRVKVAHQEILEIGQRKLEHFPVYKLKLKLESL